MDKNTITGLILMCAVIFGFMYLNQPSKEEIEAQRQQAQAARQAQAVALQEANPTDSLTAAEFAALDSLAKSDALNDKSFRLRSDNGHVAGTIIAGGDTIDIADLRHATDKTAAVAAIGSLRDAINKHNNNAPFAPALTGEDKVFKLSNDSLEVEISSKGGMITHATLKGYKAYRTQEDYKSNKSVPVELVTPENNELGFILSTNNKSFDTRDFYFAGEQKTDSTVVMTLNTSSGATWSLQYTLVPNTYIVKMNIVQKDMDKVIPDNVRTIEMTWNQQLRRQEVGRSFEERNSALYFKAAGDGDVSNLSEAGNKEETTQDRLRWISAKSQFFSTAIISERGFNGAQLKSHAVEKGEKNYDIYLKNYEVFTNLDYQSTQADGGKFLFFFGPNKYKVLSSYDVFSPKEDLKLTRLQSLGWTLFRWINTAIIIPVFNRLGTFNWSYGIIILVMTILLKLVLFPLTYKSYMSQAKMRILQPDVKALNEKYPDPEDAMKKQQKMMELYRSAGANPMGGCLPMLLQMPILIAMFWFWPSSIELRGQSFLWAPDLSAPDAIIALPFSIPFLGDHLSIFCLLMTVTNIAYTYVNMQSQSSSQMPGMKWMMYLMPIMFLFFFNTYAAGLSYYYFLSLLITILQTYLCRLFVSEEKVRAVMAENAKKPKKKSGFMARLEEAQRMQQQQQKSREQARKGNNRRR